MPIADNTSREISPLIIIAHEQWDAALFTTYALSLSFFEAHLLRNGLKRKGCEEIWVVADESNYAQALAERQALGVGQDYRVVPVAMAQGVFHPKCVYLHSKKYDALLVGSGNLTFGGYGKNVEVLEVFRSDQHPHLFGQFADFLDALSKRTGFFNPDPQWLDRFSGLARAAAGRTPIQVSNIRLIHCVDQPIIDQLSAAISLEGGSRAVRLLSPFFDADASAVAELTKRTGGKLVTIGILPEHSEASPFPFAKRFADFKTSAALIEVPEDQRRLHAKWIECDLPDGKRLVTTGSVNATWQSLCTTKNIEINVVRIEGDEVPSRLKWKKTAVPKAQSIPPKLEPGLGSRVILYASLAEGGRLHGTMLSTHDVAGEWSATLMRADGQSVDFTITVESKGAFRVRLPVLDPFELQAGLQLFAKRGDVESRCWVHNEWLLDIARVKKAPLHSIGRLLQGDADEEDNIAFIEFLAESLHQMIPRTLRPEEGDPKSEKKESDNEDRMVSVASLAPLDTPSEQIEHSPQTQSGDRMRRLISRLFGRFEDVVHGDVPRKGITPGASSVTEEDELDDEDDEDVKEERRRRTWNVYAHFRHAVQEILSSQPNEAERRRLSEVWLFTELQFLLRDDTQLDEARAFCREWLLKVTRSVKRLDPPAKLDQYIIVVAAMLGANAISVNGRKELLVGLHEALEQFGVAALDNVGLEAHLAQTRWFLGIRVDGAPTNMEGLLAVMAAPTRRAELATLQDALSGRAKLPSSLAILANRHGEELRRAHQRGERPKMVAWIPGRSACPKCSMTLNGGSRDELEKIHLTKCVQCDTFILNP